MINSFKENKYMIRLNYYYTLVFLLVLNDTAYKSQVLNSYARKFQMIFLAAELLLLVMAIITDKKMSLKKICMLAFTGLIGIYIYLTIGDTLFFFTAMLFIISDSKDCKKIAKIFFCIITSIFVFNLLCTLYYAAFDPSEIYSRISPLAARRQYDLACGGHPNSAACLFVSISILAAYIYWDKLNIKSWILGFAVTGIIYYFVCSDALIIVPVLFAFWLLRKNKRFEKIINFVIRYGIIMMLILSLIYVFASKVPFLKGVAELLNSFASGRFALSAEALEIYDITLFGANVEFGMIGDSLHLNFVYVDNVYVLMLIKHGIVFLILYQLVLFFASKKIDYKSSTIVIAWLLYGLAEASAVSYVMIFPILNAAISIYKESKKTHSNKFKKLKIKI